ncbi:FCD domain-containing protein [Paracoccus sp. N5]|uniref:FadR/GntR family transcriptional regulator n=1 Tax=Paracoccus sp. N5 TaxID=1101189 RepID=UPI001E338521|nr:FCD domain-containing protein [Paracoccus sp. N5]
MAGIKRMVKAAATRIGRVNVPRAADILASQLRTMIVQGIFPAGTQLPTERVLVEKSGLSRTSVRDALRILEAEGLIRTRAGRFDGSTVTRPQRNIVARQVELFVRTHGIQLSSLLECRVALEPTLARLAARNHTAGQLEEMTALHEKFVASVDDVRAYKAINLDWHLSVCRASGNEALIALMEAISTPVREAMDYQHVTTAELRRVVVKAHASILDAIRNRAEDQAERRMLRHVAGYRDIAIGEELDFQKARAAGQKAARVPSDRPAG